MRKPKGSHELSHSFRTSIPSPGKCGWPWTEESPQSPETMPDGKPWPKISIVTPSFNQGQYIEETIRSILLQGYPNLEYIVIDGGSTDGAVDVIRKYEKWLTYWVSEPDKGQADAINKGLERCTGEIFNWINSDDMLTPNILGCIATSYVRNNGVSSVVGDVYNFETSVINVKLRKNSFNSGLDILSGQNAQFQQPGIWLNVSKVQNIKLDSRLHYTFDWGMLIRYFYAHPRYTRLNTPVAYFREHPLSKTISSYKGFDNPFEQERLTILRDLSHDHSLPKGVRNLAKHKFNQLDWHITLKHIISKNKHHGLVKRAGVCIGISGWFLVT
jgi:glycosyltransferase involved in cell wall biosynthesis